MLGTGWQDAVMCWVAFFDNAGNHWSLTPKGTLNEYDGNPNSLYPKMKTPTFPEHEPADYPVPVVVVDPATGKGPHGTFPPLV